MPRRARRASAVAALLFLAPALTGCDINGFGKQTDAVYQPGVGANARSGDVSVLAGVVLSTTDGEGTFSANLVNSGFEDEVSFVGLGGPAVEAELAEPALIRPDSGVDLTDTGIAYVEGEGIIAGRYVDLELEFDNGEVIAMSVPVVDDQGPFAAVVEAEPGGAADTDALTEAEDQTAEDNAGAEDTEAGQGVGEDAESDQEAAEGEGTTAP